MDKAYVMNLHLFYHFNRVYKYRIFIIIMRSNKQPSVAIVVTNYNGFSIKYKSKSIIWHTLNSLEKTEYKNMHVIFADDSSTDESIKYVKNNFPWAKIVINKPNGGYTKNANKGIRYAIKELNPDFVMTMNNDVIIKDKRWLEKLVSSAESYPNCGVVGPKLLYPNGRLQQAGIIGIGPMIRNRGWNEEDASLYAETEEVSAVGGVALLIKTPVFKKIGFLDENFFMGSDDVEFCVRASKSGFKILYVGTAEIIHLEGFTSKKVSNTKGKDYWFPIFITNNIYFAFKHLPRTQILEAIFLAILSSFVGIGNRSVSFSNIKFKDRIPWRFSVSIRAIYNGYLLCKGKISRKEAYGL